MRKLIALIIPLLLLCGCNDSESKKLNDKEYIEAIDSILTDYVDGLNQYAAIYIELYDFSDLRENKTELFDACEKMGAALEKFAEINPPEEYQELHDKLLASVEAEKQYNEYKKMALTADTDEEISEYLSKSDEEGDNFDFPNAIHEIHTKYHNSKS